MRGAFYIYDFGQRVTNNKPFYGVILLSMVHKPLMNFWAYWLAREKSWQDN